MRTKSQVFAAMILAATAGSALAAGIAGPDEQEYNACVALTLKAPEDAFESAIAWRDQGGGVPAKHCVALALIQLKEYVEAAGRLETLATEMHAKGMPLQADVLDQAGNAWLLAGQTERAIGVFTAAHAIAPQNAEILIDRARSYAALQKYKDATADLDQALRIQPDHAEAHAFRASARRHLGDKAGALEDAETSLAIDPGDVDALLERGILRREAGDIKGARADWLKVLLTVPGTPTADTAQANLQDMDLKKRD